MTLTKRITLSALSLVSAQLLAVFILSCSKPIRIDLSNDTDVFAFVELTHGSLVFSYSSYGAEMVRLQSSRAKTVQRQKSMLFDLREVEAKHRSVCGCYARLRLAPSAEILARFPGWPLLALSAIYPLSVGCRAVCKARARLPGHCRICNYNLTGNTTGICPECGTAISNRMEVA